MSINCTSYDFAQIEPYWQAYWAKHKTFKANNFDERPPYYILDMFPYPSGAGLHIGHPEGYTATDILGRYKKACGFNVLHPMGWDAFGLPAEQHAIATGTPPAENTANNIDHFRGQIQRLGFGIDWDREVDTTDPEYYRWTQWIFLKLFQRNLAYVDEKPIWWCPALGTALSNEEVIDGKSERGNHPVERKNLRQWILRITAYADKLTEGLEDIDWPDSTKRQQIAWIGRSEGSTVHFKTEGDHSLSVYTTRIDTLYGVSFLAIAPEHPLLEKLIQPENQAVAERYIQESKSKSDLARTDLAKNKTGVFTGSYAINPLTHQKVPIWIADYVLMSYATGTVMGVPAHDERDFTFAKTYELPIVQVLKSQEDTTEDGADTPLPYCQKDGAFLTKNCGAHAGLAHEKAVKIITEDLKKIGAAEFTTQYKLRDWLFSRQRYWGEPFPVIWVDESGFNKILENKQSPWHEFMPEEPVAFTQNGKKMYAVPLPSSALPLTLPHLEAYQPAGTGESPLANAHEWLHVKIHPSTGEVRAANDESCGPDWIAGTRETNTMPNWAGSCWYYLRYLDPKNKEALVDPKVEAYWGAPAYYVGGAEHAVLHLLYARFWHRFLYEEKVVSQPEPFPRLFHQGIILGEDGTKMSKSKGNTINPDDVIAQHGADALRLYEMFMGPLEDMKPWNTKGIEGISRFLRRFFREALGEDGNGSQKIHKDAENSDKFLQTLHFTIQKVTEDIETLRFNTAISQLMIALNQVQEENQVSTKAMSQLTQLLAPFAPHIAEEIWARLGNAGSVAEAAWPQHDPKFLIQDTVEIPVQIDGRVRGNLIVSPTATQEEVLNLLKQDVALSTYVSGKSIKKTIYVTGKILNLVLQQ